MLVDVLDNGVELPKYESEFAAGVDLTITSLMKLFKGCKEVDVSKLDNSINNGYFTLRGHERALCGTGLFVALPLITQLEIRDRSGVALKRGLLVANSPGTIDADYRYELGVILINSTPYLNRIEIGERLAQAVLMPFIKIEWNKVKELDYSIDRGGGMGSTGTK